MNDYILMTDSTTDLPINLVKELDLNILPLTYTIENKDHEDWLGGTKNVLDVKEFYSLIRSGKMSSTSQINSYVFVTEFEKHLNKGVDILYLAFSSGLSGTYQQACNAVDELKEKYPKRKIIVVDTLCASMGEGLIAYLAAKQKQLGKSIEEVAEYVENTKLKICHWITVDDLNHLHRGGRLSATAAFMGTVLNIKPVIRVDDNGCLEAVTKTRSRKKAIEKIVEFTQKMSVNPEEQVIFISHSDSEKDVSILADMIKERLNPTDIVISYIGPVIGSHTGADTLSVFFIGNNR